MPSRRFTVSIAIETDLPGGEPVHVAATLCVPDTLPDAPLVMFCFPGGGMTQLYFDLEGASFASAMAGRGILTIAFDHPGTGASRFPDDPFQLTARHLANLESQAVIAVANQLRDGSIHPSVPSLRHLTMIGVGHSMGAMLVALQQAASKLYAAIALLGFSTRGLPEVLTPAEQMRAKQATRSDEYYIALAKQRFANSALAELPSRAGGSAALTAASAPLLTVAAMQSMLPGNIATEAATIDVPIFLGVGDRDIAGRPEAIAPRFAAAPAIRLLVLDDTGHHPFIGASADRLYDELAAWASTIGVSA
jgi:pimeloyl-ACP methyl ester carboxylesterase